MKLSTRQSEILKLIAQGQTNKEISVRLRITQATVGTHVCFILLRLHAKSRAHAVWLFFVRQP